MQGHTHLHSRYRPHTTASTAEVYRGNRHYNVCEHVGLDTNQSLHHPHVITPLSATYWGGDGPLKHPWVREPAAGRDPWDPRRVHVYVPVVWYQMVEY